MEIEPYSIYTNNRPFRIAFLVDPYGDNEWFDRIFEYNRDKWGGRFNPIIFTNGKTIDDSWWKFLKDYDPDIIFSTILIDDELKKRIHIFLSPLSVEINRPGDKYVYMSESPISILPTKKVLSYVSRGIFNEESSLVLFEIQDGAPDIIRTFISRNFGILEHGQMTPYHLKRCLESCNKKIYKITDFESLNQALLDLGDFHNRVIFPSQICSMPNSLKGVEYNYDNEKFNIIIGDTAEEISYLWNRTICIDNWMRTSITQLWLPKIIADEQSIRPGLGKFINRYVGQTGNNGRQTAHFVTFSLTEEYLKSISDSFNGVIWHPRVATKYTTAIVPNFGSNRSLFFLKRGLDFFRAHSQEEHLIINEPDVEEGGMGGEHWFVDLYIQFRSSRYVNAIDWWQLPKRNSILSDVNFFNKPSRINEFGMFSVLMRRKTEFYPDENMMIIKIPDDSNVFSALICGESYDELDRQKKFASRPFYTISRSDKGMYLSGVLTLFSDLSNAHGLLEERYWRKIFEKMSNQNPQKDDREISNIYNFLNKDVDRGHDLDSEEYLKHLAHRVLVLSKNYSKKETDLIFENFVEEGVKETEEYNQKNNGNKIEFGKDGLKRKISNLINSNILLVGIKPKCPLCGYRIWYHIDESKQKIVCKGCGNEFTVNTEERWYYKLNSLIRSAFSLHGTVPVILALGQLMFDARSSFVYIPSINLFKKGVEGEERYKLYGELDLVCIKDGQFIIGEIKQSVELFHPKDFQKIKEVAVLLKPDVVVFSSLGKEGPNTFVKDNIAKLKTDLANLEIDVQWYPIRYWAFEPAPVR